MPTVLLANLRFDTASAAYHVMTNYLGLENFVPGGGCTISISEDKKELHSCDSSIYEPRRRVLFGAYLDLYRPTGKVAPSEFKKLTKNKLKSTQDIFILQKDINIVAQKDSKDGKRAGFKKYRDTGIPFSIAWTDFNFSEE